MDNIKHYNSKGELFDFASEGILVNENDLRSFEFSYEIENYKIKRIYRDAVTKTIPMIICCDENTAINLKNKFSKHFCIDVGSEKRGYFEINGYKLYGFLQKSVFTDYIKHKGVLYITINFISDMPYWVKENTYHANSDQQAIDGKIYPISYSYEYGSGDNFFYFENDSPFDCDFKLIIFGNCSNPNIYINSQRYKVNVDVPSGGYLEIDSRGRTITKVDSLGIATNCFNNRDKTIEIFKKIPSGNIKMIFGENQKVDLIVYEERSEPKWN